MILMFISVKQENINSLQVFLLYLSLCAPSITSEVKVVYP